MQQRKRKRSEPWRYTMTAKETRCWRRADHEQRRTLLRLLAGRVMCDAVEHGRNRFVIYDTAGAVVAQGKLKPGDIEQALASFRTQNRLN